MGYARCLREEEECEHRTVRILLLLAYDSPVPQDVSQAPLVEFRNVHKRFGALVVLAGIDLKVARDESVVIIGASGSGKSVMLKHIVGLLKPDEGEVYFYGQRID